MPLIDCPECDSPVSIRAASCPNCGCPGNVIMDLGFASGAERRAPQQAAEALAPDEPSELTRVDSVPEVTHGLPAPPRTSAGQDDAPLVAARFCTSGHELADGFAFCPKCGAACAQTSDPAPSDGRRGRTVALPPPANPTNTAEWGRFWSALDQTSKRLLGAVGIGIVALVALIVGVSGGGTGSSADAGPPLSPTVQQQIATTAEMARRAYGMRPLRFEHDTGRCEVMYRIFRAAARDEARGTTITQEQADAAARPGGNLFITVDDWTGGNEEALRAVQDCVPYYVGRRL
jgi:hypothetical protein